MPPRVEVEAQIIINDPHQLIVIDDDGDYIDYASDTSDTTFSDYDQRPHPHIFPLFPVDRGMLPRRPNNNNNNNDFGWGDIQAHIRGMLQNLVFGHGGPAETLEDLDEQIGDAIYQLTMAQQAVRQAARVMNDAQQIERERERPQRRRGRQGRDERVRRQQGFRGLGGLFR